MNVVFLFDCSRCGRHERHVHRLDLKASPHGFMEAKGWSFPSRGIENLSLCPDCTRNLKECEMEAMA